MYVLDYEAGQYFYSFKGIPYAKPPVKGLRFQVGRKACFCL